MLKVSTIEEVGLELVITDALETAEYPMEDGPQYPKFSLHAELRHLASINELLISKKRREEEEEKVLAIRIIRISHRMFVR